MTAQQRQENNTTQERSPSPPAKSRSDQQHQRSSAESKRKRGDQRSAAWGDSIDRAWCTRALAYLPETFPVESHSGAATIAPRVVDRRDQMMLLCNFSHSGAHQWPELMSLIQGGEEPLPEEGSQT